VSKLRPFDAVTEAMPHYPLDEAFVAEVPEELQPMWRDWRASKSPGLP
jgi:hypothetical protein